MSLVLSAMPMYAGGADPFELWQPTTVAGFVLDINPHFNTTVDTSGGTPKCESILNNTGAADEFANANASLQPDFEAIGWAGTSYTRPSLLFDGANDYLACTTSIGSDLVGGTDTPFTMFLVGQFLTITGTRAPVFMGRSSSTSPIWDFFVDASTYKSLKRDDSVVGTSIPGGTPDTNQHVFEINQSGTNLAISVDGTNVISAAQNVGNLTIDRMTLGATFANSVPANWAHFRFARLLAFTGSLNSTDADYVRSVLTSMYM